MNKQHRGVSAALFWFDTNKPLLAKLTYACLFITYLIGVPAWPAISKGFGIEPDIGSSILIGVFIAHLGMLLSLVSDIYGRGNMKETWFMSHQEALPAIREALTAATRERPCRIVWLGVSLQSAWLALEDVLRSIEESKATEVQITLLQSQPEFLRTLDGLGDGLAGLAEGQMDYMVTRCESMKNVLVSTKSQIVLAQYSYMPNLHGLAIGDHTLFLSTVRWHGLDRSELSVPREPNELLTSITARGRYAIELHRSWVERGLRSAQTNGRYFEFPSDRKDGSESTSG